MSGLRGVSPVVIFFVAVSCAPAATPNAPSQNTAIERTPTAGLQPKAAGAAGGMAALHRGEWPAYAGTYASAKYSPLDQINAANVGTLTVAWRWTSPDQAVRTAHADLAPSFAYEATPLMVNGVLYTSTSLSQAAAIDAASGQPKWVFDPGVHK